MVKRKGVGYIIEGFVSALVIFIFVLGGISTTDSGDEQWTEFQDQISANDLGYVMQDAGYVDDYVARGKTGNIRTAFEAVSDGKLQVSGSIQGTSVGTHSIGFYAASSDILNVNLVEVGTADRCYNDLEEIPSENPILRTSGGLENVHNIRLYVADQDPATGSGYNGAEDYDTVYVDRGSECQFGSSEGPITGTKLFLWGDQNKTTVNRYYDIRSINSGSNEMILHNATLAGEMKNQSREMNQKINSQLRFDSFNFSKTSLADYDVLVFRGRKTLADMDLNHDRLLSYNENGNIMLVSRLEPSDVENNAYLNKTGLKWVNLSLKNPNSSYKGFADSDNSEKVERYFNLIGCEKCGGLSVPARDKVSSGGTNYIPENTIFPGSETSYITDKWNTWNYGMDPDSSGPIGINSGCNSPHAEGDFEFAHGTESETLTVYNTKLGSTVSDCDGTKAVTIDRNGDGDVTDKREGPFTDSSKVVVNDRTYKVNIESHTEVNFTYVGSDNYEFVNYRTAFPNRSINKFVRTGSLMGSGKLGGEKDKQIVLATSLLYWMTESDKKFGPDTDNQLSTSITGGIGNSDYIPYKMYLRWSR